MRALIPLLYVLGALSAFSESVTLLSGEMHVGELALADRFTLKISSSSGILSFPLAALSEADLDRISLQNFGLSASREFSGEPRFWHERREALRSAIAAGADPGQFAALQAEIDSHRDLIALHRDQLILKERSAYARREYAAVVRRAEFERLSAQDTAETRKRVATRIEQLRAFVSRNKEQITGLKNAQHSMRPGGPNWDAAQRKIDALERQIAAAHSEIVALEPSGTSRD